MCDIFCTFARIIVNMCTRREIKCFFWVAMVFLLSACNAVKFVPQGQYLLNDVKVKVEDTKEVVNRLHAEGYKVFAVEHKELKKRNAWVVNFDMTDNTGSIRINRFMEANEAKPILENVKPGAILQIQGKLTEDRYDNEMVLRPYAMQPGSMPKRKDTAEGMKRVELHLHTSMSNMDALTSTDAAIKQAALRDDCPAGEFNGTDVQISVQTINNRVWRIVVVDESYTNETDIKIRFNNLFEQFSNNSKYIRLGGNRLNENDDISYEMLVNNKRYDASFGLVDTSINGRVWYTIGDRYGKYTIAIFYENLNNAANGEDL